MLKSVILFLIAVAILGCSKSSSQQSKPLHKITLAYTTQPNCALVHIAVAKGYLVQEGLDVQPLIHTYGKAALQSVLDGKADLATVAETPLMFAILGGKKIFILANIYASTKNNAIVARKDRGISAPGDLRGKRIGYTPGTTADFFMDSLLTANGIERQEVIPVPLKPEEMFAALTTGKVDAASTWNFPLILLRKELGEKGVSFFDNNIFTETFNIAAQQDFVNKNPEVIKRFLRALVKAEQFAREYPAEAQNIVAASVPIDKNLLRELWSDFTFRVALDKTPLITMEDETRWAIRNHMTDRTDMPDYRSFIHVDALKAVNPDAVRIGR